MGRSWAPSIDLETVGSGPIPMHRTQGSTGKGGIRRLQRLEEKKALESTMGFIHELTRLLLLPQ